MDFTNPVLNVDWPDPDVMRAAAPLGAPVGQDHVTFGPVSVDLLGMEEVTA